MRFAIGGIGPFLAALLSVGTAAYAETGPAETPPEDYARRNYVDSNGCMFQRAGVSGSTVWIELR
ncbi:MAG: hypothetical protein WBA91_13590, partial [Paracoccaceae bacterium]